MIDVRRDAARQDVDGAIAAAVGMERLIAIACRHFAEGDTRRSTARILAGDDGVGRRALD
jgi:hypothetical protein